MDSGFRRREDAKRQRRPTAIPGRSQPPSAQRSDKRHGPPPSLWSVVGDAVHGIVFLGLAAAALLYFGQVFDVVAAIVAVLAVMSLREAWTGWRSRTGH